MSRHVATATPFQCEHFLFIWKTHCGLKFHVGERERGEIQTEVKPQSKSTLPKNWQRTEVVFATEVKFQTSLISLWISKSSRLQTFLKIGVLKNFANLTGKHFCWSLFLITLQTNIWNRLQYRCFPVKFAKSLRAPLFYILTLVGLLPDLIYTCSMFFKGLFFFKLHCFGYLTQNRTNNWLID